MARPALTEEQRNLKYRILAEGRWDDFQIEVKRLMAHGLLYEEAYRRAGLLFPPREAAIVLARTEAALPPAMQTSLAGEDAVAETATVPASVVARGMRSLTRQIPIGRVASMRTVAEWVFEHAFTGIDEIDPDGVPNRGALGLLEWVQKGAANYSLFLQSIWSKMLPTKTQLETEARFSDDGREQLLMLAEFEASFTSTVDVPVE